MHPDKPLKALFNRQQEWLTFLNKHIGHVRGAVIENVTKMLACGTAAFGSRKYTCSNPRSSHIQFINQTCKSRACNSCGNKATERWVQTQQYVLPDCEWQHITFTMPDKLWEIFRYNRPLLGKLFNCAAQILISWAKAKGLEIGIFCALHTYGRRLNWNTHIHLSVTRGGISPKTGTWKPIFFKAKETEACWRYAIITLLREQYSEIDLSAEPYAHIREERDWHHFLDSQYQWYWKVHFAKKTDNILQTVSYLGRYLKRPPVSASRLRHYSKGGMLTLDYLNHRTGQIESLTLPPAALIERLVEHIPDKGFKMIRYYGFLSNRHRGEMLPKVYKALKMEEKKKPTLPGYVAMLKGYVNVDPYECVLCQSRLVFNGYRAGTPLSELTASTLVQASMMPA
ncbi:IS91 family transposase (plasmid) [Photobacterium damselae subsp. piscicida]|uniref:IS91 family transposase n=1 Tax=Photobacterium damsela subsp. piscicida TaxID=38294 RepID=A0A5F0YP28_PHODP|nr:IS91 family transposase [Photobacterium damselae]MBE8130636.1 IS91 family transposase [Photobacterium damselae subsp. piscicida]MDP2513849.1 IS91 family transposase [Photobacterium damselae subsp. piscicida]QOD55168.1 IS91 family transposase [Photobacterium damselae subsp. piscicida]QOD58994.1 IS91 family transposase [Photobacterium damselae subsp. piscicida]